MICELIGLPNSFPSFVEQVPAAPGCESEVVSHWNPARSGIVSVDRSRGVRYFQEAMTFARAITANSPGGNGAYFVACVLKEMRCSPFGTIEQTFINELASNAAAGGWSPLLIDAEATAFAQRYQIDVPSVREMETIIRGFLISAGQERNPEKVRTTLDEWLRSPTPDGWALELVALGIAGAAMKGEAN
jgi:hypothetical protein